MPQEVTAPTPNLGGRPVGRTAPDSDAVKRVRLALNITQAEMASKLGVTPNALQRMERLGRLPGSSAPREILKKLAKQTEEVYP